MTDIIPPATLYSIHPFRQYTDEQNNLWKQLFLILDQVYVRTGGTTDEIEEQLDLISANENQIAFVKALADYLQSQVDDLKADMMPVFNPVPEWNDISISGGSYDLAPFDDVTATRGAVLTLPANPSPDEEITVRNGDGSNITIKGNGKQIFYRLNKNNIKTVNKGSILTFRYKIDIDKWVL